MGSVVSSDHEPRELKNGRAVIINHNKFELLRVATQDGFQVLEMNRDGSLKDVEALGKLFGALQCQLEQFLDCTKRDLLQKLEIYAAGLEPCEVDYLVVVAMTHGQKGGYLLASDNVAYSTSDVWRPFDNLLVGKPKFFVFQACRGNEYEKVYNAEGKLLTTGLVTKGSRDDEKPHILPSLPNNKDTFIAYSSVEHRYSMRLKDSGALFIQELCDEVWSIDEWLDVTSIFTNVTERTTSRTFDITTNQETAGASGNSKLANVGQTPIFQSQLAYSVVVNAINKTQPEVPVQQLTSNPSTDFINTRTEEEILVPHRHDVVQIDANAKQYTNNQTFYGIKEPLQCLIFHDEKGCGGLVDEFVTNANAVNLAPETLLLGELTPQLLTDKLQGTDCSGSVVIILSNFAFRRNVHRRSELHVGVGQSLSLPMSAIWDCFTANKTPKLINKPKIALLLDPFPIEDLKFDSTNIPCDGPSNATLNCTEHADMILFYGKGKALTDALLQELKSTKSDAEDWEITRFLTRVMAKNSFSNLHPCFQSTLRYKLFLNLQDEEIRSYFDHLPETTPLHEAVPQNDVSRIQNLISNTDNFDINTRNKIGDTLLHTALKSKSFDVVNYLIDAGASIFYLNKDKVTPLQLLETVSDDRLANIRNVKVKLNLALNYRRYDVFISIVKRNLKNNSITSLALQYATENKLINIIKILLKLGIDVNSRNAFGETVLHIAAGLADIQLIKFLIENKADLQICNDRGDSVLHYATCNELHDCIKSFTESSLSIQKSEDIENKIDELVNISCKKDSYEIVKYLVERGANFNAENELKNSILHSACKYCNHRTNEHLIEELKCNLNLINTKGQLPIHLAAKYGSYETIDLLLRRRAIRNRDRAGNTILHYAAQNNCEDIFISLLEPFYREYGAFNHENDTVLHYIVKYSPNNIQKYVEESVYNQNYLSKFNINAQNNEGKTALHIAAEKGYYEFLKFALFCKPNLNIIDKNNCTLLEYACCYSNNEMVNLLIENGANMNTKDILISAAFNQHTVSNLLKNGNFNVNDAHNDGTTVLHHACKSNSWEIVKEIIEKGANVNALTVNNDGILHYAAQNELHDIVTPLLELGLHADDVNKNGVSVLHLAAKHCSELAVILLIERGADVLAVDHNEDNVLHYAIKNKKHNTLNVLIRNGAIVNDINKNWESVLYSAANFGNVKNVDILIEMGAVLDKYEVTRVVLRDIISSSNFDVFVAIYNNLGITSHLTQDEMTDLLFYASAFAETEIIKFLINKGTNVVAVDEKGNNALHHTLKHQYFNPKISYAAKVYDTVTLLLGCCENVYEFVNAVNEIGVTPLHWAAKYYSDEIVGLLLNNGADIEAADAYGSGVLHFAVLNYMYDTITYLVQSGVSVNAVNSIGDTALHEAVLNNRDLKLKVLLRCNIDISLKNNNGFTAFELIEKRDLYE